MRFMLDTNICIYLIKKQPIQLIHRLKETKLADICISSITLSELEYGVEKSERRNPNKIALAEFIAPIQVAHYDDMAAAHYGKTRAYLEKKGKSLGALDMLIAAHALALKLVLITNNTKEFLRVPELKVENWVR